MESELLKKSKILADKFLQFVNLSRSPFHVVQWCRKQLNKHGYQEISETTNWQLKKGSKYFFTRNNSTLIAFHVGQTFDPKSTGFKIIGAHTDSPCIKIAPNSKANSKGYSQSYVTTYGGGLWHTWFDRDLSLAGKIVHSKGQNYTSTLWESSRPLLKIPNLAIHLRTERNQFKPNPEVELRPILSSDVYADLIKKEFSKQANIFGKHDAGLINIICEETGIKAEEIIDFDLCFADSQPSSYVGINADFISSPRLDNLFSSFHALIALLETENKGSYVNMAALFDHQQCGSGSAQGAGSNIILASLKRIFNLLCGTEGPSDNFEKTMQKSMVISADMAHGIHPNYTDKHQVAHQVQINKGPVLKINYNQRYASDLVSTSIVKIIAKKANVPVQQFVVKNDSPCGSTIGPILAAGTGIKTVDLGVAMLGMHSIRETCGIIDGAYYQDLFVSFFDNYEKISHDLLDK